MAFFSFMTDLPLSGKDWSFTLQNYAAFFTGDVYCTLLLVVAAARAGGHALVRGDRVSGRLRARQGVEGQEPRGDLPAGHPAVLEQWPGAHILVGNGAARGRHPRHCAQRRPAVQDQHRPDVFLSGGHHRAGALLRALYGADLLSDAAGDRRLADRGCALAGCVAPHRY